MLNVLRFESTKENSIPSPLSGMGRKILANASELCYLTQVVIRLFEDTQKPPDDPKKFRVEIMFSPGATATPRHMAELYREKDASRFDTEKLQKISIDGLTCTQVEQFFEQAINEGKTTEDADESSKGTVLSGAEKEKKKKKNKKAKKNKGAKVGNEKADTKAATSSSHVEKKVTKEDVLVNEEKPATSKKEAIPDPTAITAIVHDPQHTQCGAEEVDVDLKDAEAINYLQYLRNAAVTGAIIGAGCYLVMAMTKRR